MNKKQELLLKYFGLGTEALIAKDLENAMIYANKAQSMVDPKTAAMGELKMLVDVMEMKGLILRESGKEEEASRQLDEAVKLDKTIVFSDAERQSASWANSSMLLLNAGRLQEAVASANKVNYKDLGDTVHAAELMMIVANVYFRDLKPNKERAKEALLEAKAIYERSGAECADKLFEVCKWLTALYNEIENDVKTALSYCEEAWQAAMKFGIDRCDTDRLYRICHYGSLHSQELEINKWLLRSILPTAKIVDSGKLTPDSAGMFIMAQMTAVLRNMKFDPRCNIGRAMKCLNAIESDERPDPVRLALAQWLAACMLSNTATWLPDDKDGRKAMRLLKKSSRSLKAIGMGDQPSYALVKGYLGLAHSAQGQLSLAATELEEAEAIIAKFFGKDHYLAKIYSSKLAQTLKLLDDFVDAP